MKTSGTMSTKAVRKPKPGTGKRAKWSASDGGRFNTKREMQEHERRMSAVRQAVYAGREASSGIAEFARAYKRTRVFESEGVEVMRRWVRASLEQRKPSDVTYADLLGDVSYVPSSGDELPTNELASRVSDALKAYVRAARRELRLQGITCLKHDTEITAAVAAGMSVF